MKTFLLCLLLIITFRLSAQDTIHTKEELENKIIDYLEETDLEKKPRKWVDEEGITQYTYEPDFLPEYKTKSFYIPETKEEELYRIVHNRPSASYTRRVTIDPRYKKMVEDEKRISALRIKYKAIIKRKKDSIKNVRIKKLDSVRKINSLKNQKRTDSINKTRELEREKYINKQKEKQRKNKKGRLFRRLTKG